MSTSKLQRRTSDLLSMFLGKYTIAENHRPGWMAFKGARLELDFYIEELRVAIEVQGPQHYVYSPYFHGDHKGFKQRLERDEAKHVLCSNANVRLYEVANESDVVLAIEEIMEAASILPLVTPLHAISRAEKEARQMLKLVRRGGRAVRRELSKENPRPDKLRKERRRTIKAICNLNRHFFGE